MHSDFIWPLGAYIFSGILEASTFYNFTYHSTIVKHLKSLKTCNTNEFLSALKIISCLK